jgi:hypothetical protein
MKGANKLRGFRVRPCHHGAADEGGVAVGLGRVPGGVAHTANTADA